MWTAKIFDFISGVWGGGWGKDFYFKGVRFLDSNEVIKRSKAWVSNERKTYERSKADI
jgi:hypothetical protein